MRSRPDIWPRRVPRLQVHQKVVKKSDVRDGGGSFSIRIEIVDHEDGPAVLEYTAKNTNRLMNQLECPAPARLSAR